MNELFEKIKNNYSELLVAMVFSTAVYFVNTIYIQVKETNMTTIQHDKKIERLEINDEYKTNADSEILRQLRALNEKVQSNKTDIEVLKSKHY